MAALNRAMFLPYLKERWIDTDKMILAIIENAPILGMIEKKKMGGKYMHLPLLKVGAQGRSATYATAVTNAAGSEAAGFDVSYVNNFQILKIENDLVNDSDGDDNAIAEALDHEMETGIASVKKDLQLGAFGNAGGARGRIGSVAAGTAGANCRIVLLQTTDSKFFEPNMVLAVSANDGTAGGHALRDSGNTITVVGVDKIKGYLEFASDITSSISGITTNDYIFGDGDFKLKVSGFRGWIPLSDPTSGDSFHGVDRTSSVQILSGLRYSGTGKPIEQALVDALGYGDLFDVEPDLFVLNPVRWAKLVNSLGADRANRLTKVTNNEATVSYNAVVVTGGRGDVPVVRDGGCGLDECLGLKMSTWVWGYSGPRFVHVIGEGDGDGLEVRRGSGDSWQSELKSRSNLGCKQPGRNMRIALDSIV